MNRSALYLLILPLIIAPPAAAADSVDGYNLSGAFLDTVERDARIHAAQNRVAEARERLTEANSMRRPSLTVSGIVGYSHNRSEARFTQVYEGESYRGRLNFAQNLYTFGRLAGRQRRAEAEIAEAEYAFEQTRQEVLAEVARAFSEQLFRERIYESRRDFENLLGDLEGTARSRIELGTLDRTELFEVLRRLHQAKAQRIEAHSRYRVARAQLARLTGSDHESQAPPTPAAPGPEAYKTTRAHTN
ncbi:MAG: TolC family protein, partial [Gammaproteobacteria bacterium]|nr:TolC family protein [Gammaproteobacteria bacterium]